MASGGKQRDGNGVQSDWSKTGTCLSKPGDGWMHDDGQLTLDGGGVCYAARYVGCLEVTVSMKTLDFDLRTALAREAICRVAEAAGLRTAPKKKKDKQMSKFVNKSPNLTHGGADVTLTITVDSVTLVSMETNKTLLTHKMEDISFVSGGDGDTIDFVGYVGKDTCMGRACHVLECGSNRSQQVILTIAQAFELRYKQVLQNQKKKLPVVIRESAMDPTAESAWGDEPAYYNSDMDELVRLSANARGGGKGGRGQLPPPPPIPPLPSVYASRPSNLPVVSGDAGASDLYSEVNDTVPMRSPVYENTNEALLPTMEAAEAVGITATATTIHPAHSTLREKHEPTSARENAYSLAEGSDDSASRLSPYGEPWFHGKLDRRETEAILKEDGDFLVRESTSSGKVGQYVLSGVKGGIVIHLLLVDPEGVVRTKDRTFDSVSHLINYHKDNRVPILSLDLELYLANPVAPRH